MKKIIHNECDCLWANDCFDDKCRKRWFLINDVENNEFIYLAICNQHLSLLINNEVHKHKNTWDSDRVLIYENIVKKIISSYVNLGNTWCRDLNNNDLSSRSISFKICERPYISRFITLLDSIELYLKNNSWELEEKIIDTIQDYINSNSIYKKYKTKYKDVIRLSKKLKSAYKEERETIIIEIFTNILELNSKLPIKNNKRKIIKT